MASSTLIPGGYGNPTGAIDENSSALTTPIPGTNTGSDANISQPNMIASGLTGNNLLPSSTTTNTNNLIPTANSAVSTVPGATPTTTGTTSFPANTSGTTDTSSLNGANIASILGLASPNNTNILSNLNSIFGGGIGDTLYAFLQNGAGYNQDATNALLNANIPAAERSEANINEQFGAAGAGQSSAAAIGLGDFESNYALGQQQILANQYNNAVSNYTNLFGGILNTAYDWKQNQLNGLGITNGILSALAPLLATLGKPSTPASTPTGGNAPINTTPSTIPGGTNAPSTTSGTQNTNFPSDQFPPGTVTDPGTPQQVGVGPGDPSFPNNSTDVSGQGPGDVNTIPIDPGQGEIPIDDPSQGGGDDSGGIFDGGIFDLGGDDGFGFGDSYGG